MLPLTVSFWLQMFNIVIRSQLFFISYRAFTDHVDHTGRRLIKNILIKKFLWLNYIVCFPFRSAHFLSLTFNQRLALNCQIDYAVFFMGTPWLINSFITAIISSFVKSYLSCWQYEIKSLLVRIIIQFCSYETAVTVYYL